MDRKYKPVWALRIYKMYVGRGMDRPTAAVKAIDSVADTWMEYVEIYNTIKEDLK